MQKAGFHSSPFVELQFSCCPGGGEPAQQRWIELCSGAVQHFFRSDAQEGLVGS